MSYTDTYLVEKLREIFLRLYPTPRTDPVKSVEVGYTGGEGQFEKDNNVEGAQGTQTYDVYFNRTNINLDIFYNNTFELSLNDNVNYNTSETNFSTFLLHGEKRGMEKLDDSVGDSKDVALMKNLQEFIKVLKMSMNSEGSSSGGNKISSAGSSGGISSVDLNGFNLNLTLEDISDLNSMMDDEESSALSMRHLCIILSYFLIACVSIVGNLLVVQLVIRSRRLHTITHALLANLAVADLLMATLNIPFSALRVILFQWPFGSFLCKVVPFVQVTSVYVTSITMAVIAIDRYQVIMNPLGLRMKNSQGVLLVFGIWTISAVFSLPYAINHKVVTILTVRVVERCQLELSSMKVRQWLTVATFVAQYFLPLLFTTVSYVFIMMRLRKRSLGLGSTTPRQMAAQSLAKRKTIKMLVLTVIFFAFSWAPINIYHLLTHFSVVRHNSTAILFCHLIAMSSSCYNPFIYCWLNEHFRREALKWFRCFRTRRSPLIHPGIEVNGMLTRADILCSRRNQSSTLARTLSFRNNQQNQQFPLENINRNLNINTSTNTAVPSLRAATHRPELLFLAHPIPPLTHNDLCQGLEQDLETSHSLTQQRPVYVELQIHTERTTDSFNTEEEIDPRENTNNSNGVSGFDPHTDSNNRATLTTPGISSSENIVLPLEFSSQRSFMSNYSLNGSGVNSISNSRCGSSRQWSASCGEQV